MIIEILSVMWFFLAAGISNTAPMYANKIPKLNQWNTPLDFGYTYNGKRIFGKNKTWRGLIFGIILAIIVVYIQKLILNKLNSDVVVNGYYFTNLPTLASGLLLGAGPLVGDAIESFFKRQREIAPGSRWFPFDQIDYVIGAIIFSLPLFRLQAWHYLSIIIIGVIATVIASYIAFHIKLKDVPY